MLKCTASCAERNEDGETMSLQGEDRRVERAIVRDSRLERKKRDHTELSG